VVVIVSVLKKPITDILGDSFDSIVLTQGQASSLSKEFLRKDKAVVYGLLNLGTHEVPYDAIVSPKHQEPKIDSLETIFIDTY
jgi:hypothetical protein